MNKETFLKLIEEKNELQEKIKNLDDVEKIYKPAAYSNGPNGGHPQDPHNRRYIHFDEAINI